MISILSLKVFATAPVPLNMSITIFTPLQFSSTVFLIKSEREYLFPKYRLLFMNDCFNPNLDIKKSVSSLSCKPSICKNLFIISTVFSSQKYLPVSLLGIKIFSLSINLYKYDLEMSNSFITSVTLRLAIFIPPCHILIYLVDIIAYFTHFFYIFIKKSDANCIKKMESIKFIILSMYRYSSISLLIL